MDYFSIYDDAFSDTILFDSIFHHYWEGIHRKMQLKFDSKTSYKVTAKTKKEMEA